MRFLATAGVSRSSYPLTNKTNILGVNCTKTDLDAITAARDDVEIVDYNTDLYYEKYYE